MAQPPNLYSTPEASKMTGIPEGTIRSWLSRYPQVFQVNIHVIVEESGRKMWTDAGIELLRSRATQNAAANVADSDAGDLLEAVLDHDAEILATEYWRQLPGRLLSRIRTMRDNPTPQQRDTVKTAVQSAINAGTSHLLLPNYQPFLLEGGNDEE